MAEGDHVPSLTIGLPVYNGERYLPEVLETLRKQDFDDFVVHISDNASTDRTEKIARTVVASDSRFRYVRHATNHGPAWNWNYVARNTASEYFAWIGADDLFDPQFYARCVQRLRERPDAAAAFTAVEYIDESGLRLAPYEEPGRWSDPDPAVRFAAAASFRQRCQLCYAVVRRSALLNTRLIMPYPGSDHVYIAELVLQGPVIRDPATMFYIRDHRGRNSRRSYAAYFAEAGVKRRRFVALAQATELFRATRHPTLPWSTRWRLRADLARWSVRNSVRLARHTAGETRALISERLRRSALPST